MQAKSLQFAQTQESRMKTFDSHEWGDVWINTDSTKIDEQVAQESISSRCQRIFQYLETHLGSVKGKKTIELGSGGGIYSLILAQHGADVTLLDYSAKALKYAERNLAALNLNGHLVQGDAFNPPACNSFDIAMSFGTVEHYHYPKRYDICKSHLDVVKPGGIVIISTPNLVFLPHEVLKFALQKIGKWGLGYEGSFSRKEMYKMAERLQVISPMVIGSSFANDLKFYARLYRYNIALTAHKTPLLNRYFSYPTMDLYWNGISQKQHWIDNYLGFEIVMLGRKPMRA
ncbi:MAG: hypothetical protein DPW16_11170 [Chloroflexi bacterium]|nr:hypothetical protein [Chloroflexota bacterium]